MFNCIKDALASEIDRNPNRSAVILDACFSGLITILTFAAGVGFGWVLRYLLTT